MKFKIWSIIHKNIVQDWTKSGYDGYYVKQKKPDAEISTIGFYLSKV